MVLQLIVPRCGLIILNPILDLYTSGWLDYPEAVAELSAADPAGAQ